MVGFVCAMSSSLSILMLIFLTLFMSYMQSLAPDRALFKVDGAVYRYPMDSYYITKDTVESLNGIFLELKKNKNFVPEKVTVGCTSGFDISSSIATNITTFNMIKLNEYKFPLKSIMRKDDLVDNTSLNYCFVDFETEEEANNG